MDVTSYEPEDCYNGAKIKVLSEINNETMYQAAALGHHGHSNAFGVVVRDADFSVGELASGASMVTSENTLKTEIGRLATFLGWPSHCITPDELAAAGFYYLNSGDRVKCAFCGGILKHWQTGDKAITEHLQKYPQCKFVQGQEVGNVPRESGSRVTNVHELGVITPSAKWPDFASESTRIQSFQNSWPSSVENPTPYQLAIAGFFYEGTGDLVRCFCCDGGLRGWKSDDDAWIEHARWFPECQFIRYAKGEAFIQSVVEKYSSQNAQNLMKNEETPNASASPRKRYPDSPRVAALMEIGYNRELVQRVIKRNIQRTGSDFPNMDELMNALSRAPEEELSSPEDVPPSSSNLISSTSSVASKNMSIETILLAENERLREQRLCKICMEREISMTFLPCGHFACCSVCAQNVEACPICRTSIRGTLRTYLP